ncbi:LysE family translocator [Naasia aerilata]|uniref:Lysine transporter LysE n=1 Tax=Naasia aerilata TaxID=1162966 RepID=A0ABN6XLB2_9MICO|nr:LysE family translocator [Naasia aerilata]BDZ45739.1 lysine transporter LysE [Naasia aerilata]
MTIEFLATALVLAALPGPGVIYTLSTGMSHGPGSAVLAAVGCVLGALPYAVASAVGLGVQLAASAVLFEVVKWAGVAYLLFMGVRTWRDTSRFELHDDPRPRTVVQLVGYGALVSLLNPKIPIFFSAFLPRFLGPEGGDATALSFAFLLVVLVVYVAYGLLAALFRRRLLAHPRGADWTRRVFAASYVLIATRLAFQTR